MVRHSAELCPQKNYLRWMKLLGYINCFGNAFARCFLNSRIVKRISKVSVLDNATFADVMDSLRSCWRSREAPTAEKPISDDKFWIRLLKCDGEMLVARELVTAGEDVKSSKRRPPPKGKECLACRRTGCAETAPGTHEDLPHHLRADAPEVGPVREPHL